MLISALLNSQDVTAARSLGLPIEFIEGYPSEYNWLLGYYENYGVQPSAEAFNLEYPEFRIVAHEDVRSAVDAVYKSHGRRRLTAAMTRAYDHLSYGDLETAYAEITSAQPRRTTPPMKKALTDLSFLDDWDLTNYVEVPYRTIQRHTGGIQPGNLWYWAARPGQGKTAHVCNLVRHAVRAGNRVRFFSLEMSEDEVRSRFHAAYAQELGYPTIDLNSLRNRSVDRHTYKEFIQELDDKMLGWGGEVHIHTPANGPVSPSVVAGGADEFHLTVVDYIGLMKTDSGTASIEDWRTAAIISNSLKEIALAEKTGILAAAQINRDGDTGSAPPKLSQLSQSDALGQDADVLVTMRAAEHNVATNLSLVKNRHGASDIRLHTIFDPNRGRFDEITADAMETLVLDAEMNL
jgi:replicative DNA helicase